MLTIHNEGPKRVGRIVASALVLLLPTFVTLSLWLGLGLRSGAPTALSAAAALALTLLPIAGLSAAGLSSVLLAGLARIGFASHSRGWALAVAATWLWSLAFWIAFPHFAPGQRRPATQEGARVLLSWWPDPASETLAGLAGALVSVLGNEGETPSQTRSRTETNHAIAEPAPQRPAPPPAPTRTQPRAQRGDPATGTTAVVLPYSGDGRILDVEVGLDGPDYGDRFRMIFDTGASFTTLTPAALERIDVRVPADAPRVRLNTAGGEIEAPLVLLDAVWLGDQPIEWVTVAVCSSCTARDRAGLLGLNVSSQFRVEIDHARKRIHLDPQPGDRRHDIRAWIDLHARGTRYADDRIEMEVTLESRAPHGIASATVEIDCGSSGYAVQIKDIPARGEARSSLRVPGVAGETICDSFSLELLSAKWAQGRF